MAKDSKKKGFIGSFLDAVRRPRVMVDMATARERMMRDIAEDAKALADQPEQIAALVDEHVFDGDPNAFFMTPLLRLLRELGGRSYPRALELLGNPDQHARLLQIERHKEGSDNAPICRLCELFDGDAPPPGSVGTLLIPFSKSGDAKIRRSVALILGSVGSKDMIPELRRLLDDTDDYVKSYTLMGVQRAISRGAIADNAIDDFFDLVSARWPYDKCFAISDKIPCVLLDLDRPRAVARLLEKDLFIAGFQPAWRILQTFDEKGLQVPRPCLLELFGQLDLGNLSYPQPNFFEYGLPLLANWRNADDVSLFEALLDHPDDKVTKGASKALYRFYNLSDDWYQLDQLPWSELSVVQQHHVAIRLLDMAIRSGGMTSYFFNGYATRADVALEGLLEIQAPHRHQILLDCVARFGKRGPAKDVDTLRRQLSKLVTDNTDPFHDAGLQWLAAKEENLDRLLFRYQLARRKVT